MELLSQRRFWSDQLLKIDAFAFELGFNAGVNLAEDRVWPRLLK